MLAVRGTGRFKQTTNEFSLAHIIYLLMVHHYLVGGFNPFEKY